ncbi:hypothetical protein BC739_001003 [Kutzneria viridogrisea]|uniref:Uncharacterized protein n=1 Tax=Kutzneria viridogrisea TaxID=47990 RepID=A0ABR6BAC3_9PSEU|nr:hypothetical protein [Kutzneria viridogrisea]
MFHFEKWSAMQKLATWIEMWQSSSKADFQEWMLTSAVVGGEVGGMVIESKVIVCLYVAHL